MMIHSSRGPKEITLIITAVAIAGTLLFAVALLAMNILKTFVPTSDFPTLTTIVAVTGATIALSQFRRTGAEKRNASARNLIFCLRSGELLHLLLSRPLPPGHQGEIVHPFMLSQDRVLAVRSRIAEISSALDEVKLDQMPSATTMLAVVRLRAAAKATVAKIERDEAAGAEESDFEDEFAEILNGTDALGKERDRLFPHYQIGNGVIFTTSEMPF